MYTLSKEYDRFLRMEMYMRKHSSHADVIMKNALNAAYCYHANPIRKVIFNPPATIVFWFDGSKTVVKARGDDEFDPETGLAMAISKHYLCDICGLKRYDGIFNKFIPHNQKNKE